MTARLSIAMPERGEVPSEFRRKLHEALRNSAAHLHFAGKIDAEIVEEIYRALPVDEARQ